MGAHRLRHTLACDMVRAGVPLPEISQVLRHHSLASTAIYARVRCRSAPNAGPALAERGGGPMSDFDRHVHDYLQMRRALGFKLRREGQVLVQLAATSAMRSSATLASPALPGVTVRGSRTSRTLLSSDNQWPSVIEHDRRRVAAAAVSALPAGAEAGLAAGKPPAETPAGRPGRPHGYMRNVWSCWATVGGGWRRSAADRAYQRRSRLSPSPGEGSCAS